MVKEGWDSFPPLEVSTWAFQSSQVAFTCQPLSFRLRWMQLALIRIHMKTICKENNERGEAGLFNLPCPKKQHFCWLKLKHSNATTVSVHFSCKTTWGGRYVYTLRKREFEKGSKVGVYLLAATKNQLSNHRRCFPLLVGCSQAFQTHTREQRLRSDDEIYLTQPSFQECHCLRYVIMIKIKSWSTFLNHCQNRSWSI